ncbi:MAG: aminotransferase class I/II-fold pyridoxal phosphate-dependent enzyme [bacterium]|nr:aminotransferase class I/II-fold pyridoxal phosphate-dependent enzyme [bacterium]
MIRPISISLSPNTESDDVFAALRLYVQPWRWRRGEHIEKFEEEFKEYMGVPHAISFNSGRSAFLALLKSLDLHKDDEVLIQAFTCNAVSNPVLWAGLTPVYVDCQEDYNMSAGDLERKITPRSRVVVVQHTFGLPADMDKIMEVCQRHNLVLLEDCAHALGATYKGKKVGTFGKAAFFSFSRDKVISSVYGGMATTNDEVLAGKLREFQREAGYPSYLWIKQQVLHPWLMNLLILPTYRVFGRYLLVAAQWIHMLSKAVHKKEKRGQKPRYFPKALPNVLAILASRQFKKLERFNSHRRHIAALYEKALPGLGENGFSPSPASFSVVRSERESVYLRFVLRHPRAHEIIRKAWRANILLGDWYTTVVAPHDTEIDKMGYEWGSCPKAEELSRITLNLPTHIRISEKEVNTIIVFLKNQDPKLSLGVDN